MRDRVGTGSELALDAVLQMSHPRVGRYENPRTGDLSPPADVDVLAMAAHRRVVAVEPGEQIAADQRADAGHCEHVADGVVLLLVELVAFNQCRGLPGLVGRQPHRQQPFCVEPVDDLRTDDAGVGAECLLHEHADGVGLGRGVVVGKDQVGGVLHQLENVVGGLAVAGPRRQPPDVGAGQDAGDASGGLFVTSGVKDEDREVGVVLRPEGRQRLLEPLVGVAGHDDRHHRRGHGGGVHVAVRLAKWPAAQGSASACNCLTRAVT